MIRVRFQRFAKDNSAPLVVNFTTTMASADFEQTADRAVMESGTVTIPAGENAVEVVLAAISEDPAANEGIEIFTVTVTPGTYDVVQTAAGFDKKNVLSVNYERKYYILEGVTLFATPDPAVEPDIFIDDILQGGVNDCFALAAMGALILENPERLRSLFTTIDDTHYVVKLYDATAGEWKDISVTVDLTRGINMAKVTGDVDPATGKAEIWPIVLEQAYAQLAGGYAVLEQGGLSPGVWTALTGVSATTVSPGTSDDAIGQQIVNALKGPNGQPGQQVVINTFEAFAGGPVSTSKGTVVSKHAYVVRGIVQDGGETYVEIYDPLGDGEVRLSWDDLKEVTASLSILNSLD